jgi:hypothetical protein
MVKLAWASDDSFSAELHPWLNPELHPWSDLDWQGITNEDQPKSLQFQVYLKTFQAEPTVELWLSIWAAPVQWYSDNKRSRSTVRTTLVKHQHQDLINTWLSRLRQEGEFTITSKSTFQRRSTCNQHWLPLHLLYLRYLFHITVCKCHSNPCICILFWNTHLHSRIYSWLLETWVELVRQSLMFCYPTLTVSVAFPVY